MLYKEICHTLYFKSISFKKRFYVHDLCKSCYTIKMQNTSYLLPNETVHSKLFIWLNLFNHLLHTAVINLTHSCLCQANTFCSYSVKAHFIQQFDQTGYNTLNSYIHNKHFHKKIFFQNTKVMHHTVTAMLITFNSSSSDGDALNLLY